MTKTMKTMKNYNIILIISAFIFSFGCKDGYIDEITRVEPGPDETAPQIEIQYPLEGTEIQVPEPETTINIQFSVTDDIEIQNITLLLDETEIVSFTEFKDYRRVMYTYSYESLTNGDHTLTIEATDLDGKTTSESVNFSKTPPYVPKYNGEVLYMPFDGDYMDLVSFQTATVEGNPGFAGESVVGLNAYGGAENSYLTFSGERFQNNEFSAVFWMKVNADPNRAGILVMGPPDPDNPNAPNNRESGFRFFREDAAGMQRFKLNVGDGSADTWFDGGEAADVDPTANEWVHFAFTITNSSATVYIDGQVVKQGDFGGIDWTGCDILSIMSGAPRFTGWNHFSDEGFMDELRIFNRALSESEINGIIQDEMGGSTAYQPKYEGETFYMPFDGDFMEMVSGTEATVVGSPGFAGESVKGDDAYEGAADSYLTFPTDGLQGEEFSAVFWHKVNADPDRAGILVMGPPDTENPDYPDVQNLRNNGFRFFREAAGEMQRFKLNAGDGAEPQGRWFDGGEDADIDPTSPEWVHMAFTISSTECVVYINGEIVKQGDFDGIDWTGCDILSIMSGEPRFNGWNHFSDLSYMDELRLFNKALTQQNIQTIMNDEQP